MTKTCVAVRHVHFEDLGSFARPIQEAGYVIQYLEAGIDDLMIAEQADILVFLGGPIGVDENTSYLFLTQEINIAEQRIAQNKATLGLCLGSQIIARAMGAKVYPGTQGKEIGWKPIKLTDKGKLSTISSLGDDNAQMLHWHGDTFDLPQNANLLASTDAYNNQIYSVGTSILAFQCHPEFNPENVESWLIGHALEIAETDGVSPQIIRADTKLYGKNLIRRGQKMIQNWLEKQQT